MMCESDPPIVIFIAHISRLTLQPQRTVAECLGLIDSLQLR